MRHVRAPCRGSRGAEVVEFGRADGGTLVLEEVGELPLPLKSTRVRLEQDGTLTRLGASREIRVDVRVVVATHRNLVNDVAMGRFRRDLYYRLNVVPIRLPALRERPQAICPVITSDAAHDLTRR